MGTSDLPPNPKQIFGDKKVPLGLVPPSAILYAGLALSDGARKYGAYNWREKSVEAMTYIHACQRHLMAWQDGEELASDSGFPHLGHAIACLAILIDTITIGNLIDNRPKPGTLPALLLKHEKKPAEPVNGADLLRQKELGAFVAESTAIDIDRPTRSTFRPSSQPFRAGRH
jgi:hypothetical protein